MNILLTNDDGIDHSGIKSLFLELYKNHNVFVMAPDRNRSGFGSAITFLTETNAKKLEENNWVSYSKKKGVILSSSDKNIEYLVHTFNKNEVKNLGRFMDVVCKELKNQKLI